MGSKDAFAYLSGVHYRFTPKYQSLEMFFLGFLGFMVPFAVGHPQLLVGVLVNAFIVRAALSLPSYKALPVVLTPSLGALARGMIFGPYSVYLIYMVPFIWVGNCILLSAFKLNLRGNLNFLRTLFFGGLAKAVFLFSAAYVLYSAGILPKLFLTAMGVVQLATAWFGGLLVYAELRIHKR